MANLIFAQYVADAITYDDGGGEVAYHYVGTTASAPNADVADITDQNIAAYTFAIGDPQGKTVYTKCEHAVSFYLPENTASVVVTTGGTYYDVYTAPSDGVARVYAEAGYGHGSFWVKVNGTLVINGAFSGKYVACALNLNSGDVVSVTTTVGKNGYTASVGFLPDSY